MGDLEFGESVLETMILNGKNEKAKMTTMLSDDRFIEG